jgi:hypothetical protein
MDGVPWRQSSQDEVNSSNQEPLNENRFLLRRGRVRLDVERGAVSGALELDANTVRGPQARPIAAEVSYRLRADHDVEGPRALLTLGLVRTPFGFECAEGSRARPFLERSTFVTGLFTQTPYDLGLRFQGAWRFLRLTMALMNGSPLGQTAFAGRDPNQSKDAVGRLGFDADPTSWLHVEGGVSALTGQGFHRGNPTTKDVLVWRDGNEDGIVQTSEIQVVAGSPATASANFSRFALGADLRVQALVPRLGTLAIRGEIVRASNLDRGLFLADPVAQGRDLREFGFSVGLTQALTSYGLLGARYDVYDPDADASQQQGLQLVPRDNTLSTFSVVGALLMPSSPPPSSASTSPSAHPALPGARFLVQYDHRRNALGRGFSGLPTTLADDSLTLRGEVAF